MSWRRMRRANGAAGERVDLLDGWSIEVPAGFARERESDGAVVLWDATRTIRVMTVATTGRADGSPLSGDEMLGEATGTRERLEGGVVLDLGVETEEEIDGERVFTVPVRGASENQLASVFVHGREPGIESWAHALARTLVR
jgi:hypothetical protein